MKYKVGRGGRENEEGITPTCVFYYQGGGHLIDVVGPKANELETSLIEL